VNDTPGTPRSRFSLEGPKAIAVAIAAIAGTVFTFKPDWRPLATTTKRADVQIISVDRGFTRDQWRWQAAAGDTSQHSEFVRTDAEELGRSQHDACQVIGGQAGHIVVARTTAQGFKERELVVRAELFAYPSRRKVETTDLEMYRKLDRIPVEAPTDSSVQQVWLADAETSGRLFARVGLYDEEDFLLAVANSKPFTPLTGAELRELKQAEPREC
jgi:hypothetical protein